jgi:hypothetical protein
MKKNLWLIVCILFLSINIVKAQDTTLRKMPNKIGFTFSGLGKYDVVSFEKMDGAPSYEGAKFFSMGIVYLHSLNHFLDLESGIEYSSYSLLVKPAPGINSPALTCDFGIITVPLQARINFLKYFFIDGGVILSFDAGNTIPIDSQTGLGGVLGAGIKYDFKNRLSLFVNPYLKIHSLLPFSKEEGQQRILESCWRLGITWKL